MRKVIFSKLSLLSSLFFCAAAMAHANTTTVLATDSVYAATPITFSVSTGRTVTVNGGGNYNDADGIGSASEEYNNGFKSLSGITTPTAGYIAGVFLDPGGPSGPAAPLSFANTGSTSRPNDTNFSSLSPTADQVFFVGDGLTGDGAGATQIFYIPTGATELYLGLADACGYNGNPDGGRYVPRYAALRQSGTHRRAPGFDRVGRVLAGHEATSSDCGTPPRAFR
ncbi:MAG: hypothetical protein M3Y57_13260 [Acidobacteriota bacterium]|nr:hypothetical protein [Acidobacteriota bacterium]